MHEPHTQFLSCLKSFHVLSYEYSIQSRYMVTRTIYLIFMLVTIHCLGTNTFYVCCQLVCCHRYACISLVHVVHDCWCFLSPIGVPYLLITWLLGEGHVSMVLPGLVKPGSGFLDFVKKRKQ